MVALCRRRMYNNHVSPKTGSSGFLFDHNRSCLPTKVGVHPQAVSRLSVFGETWMHADLCRSLEDGMEKTKVRHDAARIRRFALRTHDGACAVCGFHAGRILRLHHITPVSKGGTNDASNLTLLCPNCHDSVHELARRARAPIDSSEWVKTRSWEMFEKYMADLEDAYGLAAGVLVDLAQKAI